MQVLIRLVSREGSLEHRQQTVGQFVGLRVGASRLQVFLSIQRGCLYMCDSTLIGRAHQDHIGGKHLLVLNQANVTHDNLAPLYCLGLALPEDNCCLFVVVAVVAHVPLVVLVPWVKMAVP
jgi:hypothetical protein